MSVAIKCPKCKRTLGDTTSSIDATINCKRCGAQHIRIDIANFNDYLKATSQGENNDKS